MRGVHRRLADHLGESLAELARVYDMRPVSAQGSAIQETAEIVVELLERVS